MITRQVDEPTRCVGRRGVFGLPFSTATVFFMRLFLCAPLIAQHGQQYLRVSFIDVGQGDAIWIQTPAGPDGSQGKNILIDGGPDRGAKNRVIQYFKTYGLKPGSVIDCIVATHPHTDHFPGLIDVLDQYQVRTIIDSGYPKEGVEFATFVKAAKAETVDGAKSKLISLRDHPETVLDWGIVTAAILYADSARNDMGVDNDRENNASMVIKLTYGDISYMFMGDAEGKSRKEPATTTHYVEEALLAKYLAKPETLRATVLKAGHHGSETSSTAALLKAVQPEVVVVMSGRKAFSGTYLPDQSVLNRYSSLFPHLTIVRTDQDDDLEGRDTTNDADGDDIYTYTDGASLRIYQARGPTGRRRWALIRTLQGGQ